MRDRSAGKSTHALAFPFLHDITAATNADKPGIQACQRFDIVEQVSPLEEQVVDDYVVAGKRKRGNCSTHATQHLLTISAELDVCQATLVGIQWHDIQPEAARALRWRIEAAKASGHAVSKLVKCDVLERLVQQLLKFQGERRFSGARGAVQQDESW